MKTVNLIEEIDIIHEDFEELILAFENSFGIKFQSNEFIESKIKMKDLIQLVTNKIELQHSTDCTSQQIFYQLRSFFEHESNISQANFNRHLHLEKLMPRKNRREIIQKIEQTLDIKLEILKIKKWLSFSIMITFCCSIYFLFTDLNIGLLLLLIFVVSTKIKGSELIPTTIGDLTDKIVEQNYRHLKNKKNSFNPIEIKKIIFEMTANRLGFDLIELGIDTQIKF